MRRCLALQFNRLPSYNTPLCEAPMPFIFRHYHRFPVHCSVTYNAGLLQGQGTCGHTES